MNLMKVIKLASTKKDFLLEFVSIIEIKNFSQVSNTGNVCLQPVDSLVCIPVMVGEFQNV